MGANFVRKKTCVFSTLTGLTVLVLSTLPFPAHSANKSITIGTGGKTGVYYPTGVAVCNAVNKRRADHNIHCTAQSTDGSVDNVGHIRAGEMTFGVVQSDVQFYAMKGYGPFKGKGPDTKMRAVLSFHPEVFTVVARADAGIKSTDDLKGKRVNIGNPGSGQRTSMDLVMNAKKWTKADFAEALELPSSEQAKALCENKIDAFVFTAGHPNASIKKAADTCDVVLVNVADRAIKHLVKKFPYFVPAIIKGGTYKGTGWSTQSFGVTATLVTSKDTPDRVVYQLVKSVFKDFIDLRFSHAALSNLDSKVMISTGQSVPYHKGALKYFKQMGYEPKVDKVRRAPKR